MTMLDDLPEFLTVEETAALLRVHPRTIRNRINAGLLPAKQVKGGKSRLIAKADVWNLLEDVVPTSAPLPVQAIPGQIDVEHLANSTGGREDESISGEHLQKVQRALKDNPVGFRRWVPKAQEDDQK